MAAMPSRLDIASARFKADPFPTFERMRREGPVLDVKVPFLGTVKTTSTHAATEAVVKRAETFVIEGRHAGRGGGPAGLRWWMPPIVRRLADNMLGRDDPEHRRLRRIVDGAFRRRAIEGMESAIARHAERLLHDRRGETDLVPAFARRLPLDVISELLGLPEEDADTFAREAERAFDIRSAWSFPRAVGGIRRLSALLERRIAETRAAGGGTGLITNLVETDEDGDRLNANELLSMCFLLLVAGFETTTHLIANSVVALEAHRGAREEWREGSSPRALEELLRYTTPVQVTKPRFVARDLELEGIALRRGQVVMPCLAAANADPAVFDDPAKLDLGRFPNPHLSFSAGPHFCLGMQLARMEAKIALDCLYARFPDLRISEEPAWTPRIGIRAMPRLLVDLR